MFTTPQASPQKRQEKDSRQHAKSELSSPVSQPELVVPRKNSYEENYKMELIQTESSKTLDSGPDLRKQKSSKMDVKPPVQENTSATRPLSLQK
jgi:hypothetical protein